MPLSERFDKDHCNRNINNINRERNIHDIHACNMSPIDIDTIDISDHDKLDNTNSKIKKPIMFSPSFDDPNE